MLLKPAPVFHFKRANFLILLLGVLMLCFGFSEAQAQQDYSKAARENMKGFNFFNKKKRVPNPDKDFPKRKMYPRKDQRPPEDPNAKKAIRPVTADTIKGGKRIELVYAGVLEGDVLFEEPVRIVRRDTAGQVHFIHKNTVLFCDSAFQYITRNKVMALGNIKFIENDSMTITGDTLYYDGNTRLAQLRGNVLVVDEVRTIKTRHLDYDLNARVAYYFNGGSVEDDSLKLTSERGYYYTDTKKSEFKGKVKVVGEELNLKSDSLTYDANTKIVNFESETTIKTRDGTIIANAGSEYNTLLGTSKMVAKPGEKVRIETKEYIISADSLDRDNLTEKGKARKNVEFYSKKENFTVYGDAGNYDGLTDRVEVFGRALLVRPMKGDTLFLTADTLIAYDDTLNRKREMHAYPRVKVYKSDMQAICDTLHYMLRDSVIQFRQDPVLWSLSNQLTATLIDVEMSNNILRKMYMKERAYVVSEDTFKNYNQIKGRHMTAFFNKKGRLNLLDVVGNGECIYNLLDEAKDDVRYQGQNNINCSNMKFYFNEENAKLRRIAFLQTPEGRVIPPHELKEKDRTLKDFKWRSSERPVLDSVLGVHAKAFYTAQLLPKGVLEADDSLKVYRERNILTFFKVNATPKDLKNDVFVQITPKDVKDLGPEWQAKGAQTIIFKIPNSAIQHGILNFVYELPFYEIKSVMVGQQITGKGRVWQKNIIFRREAQNIEF
ncbi:MAG: hypothetical protein EAZ57_01060 [Cytophagales bacterium]|nr:MAG: hypothetical protein EAZ67_00070 [Cytophagales bacterium]TAF62374.1 MAG: hypothetical protein EAZ57_01060 [Cytophagales bacterium]